MAQHNRVALVTGGARGLGLGIAKRLHAEGCFVVLADLNAKAACEAASALGERALGLGVDVADQAAVIQAIQKVQEQAGGLDVLVNNAGWDKIEPFLKSEPATWQRIIAINLYGVFHMCHAALPWMIQQGGGRIVNIGSDAGRVGSSGEAVYAAAKGGVIAFTKTLAREMARHRITVNCVCPGPSDTPLFAEIQGYNPGIAEALVKAIPMRRLGLPEDIAHAVAFFVAEQADFITGQTLSVSGGLTMV
jgi:2-hydroxycyclohexanecarboxyl-CoA dehydrogenase